MRAAMLLWPVIQSPNVAGSVAFWRAPVHMEPSQSAVRVQQHVLLSCTQAERHTMKTSNGHWALTSNVDLMPVAERVGGIIGHVSNTTQVHRRRILAAAAKIRGGAAGAVFLTWNVQRQFT